MIKNDDISYAVKELRSMCQKIKRPIFQNGGNIIFIFGMLTIFFHDRSTLTSLKISLGWLFDISEKKDSLEKVQRCPSSVLKYNIRSCVIII